MDQVTLVERDIEAGRRLIGALDAADFPVAAALWQFSAEEGAWRLVIASPKVNKEGPRAAYTAIQSIVRETGVVTRLSQISAVPDNDPVVMAFRIHSGTAGKPYLGGTYFRRTAVGDVFVDDAYVYRAERIVLPSGTLKFMALVYDKQAKAWRTFPAVMTYREGHLQDVKVEGHDLPYAQSNEGITVQFHTLQNPRQKDGHVVGDVQRMVFVKGGLRGVENVAEGVRIIGVPGTEPEA